MTPTKLTPKKRQQFLGLVANGASITRAARSIRMSRQYMYELRVKDLTFAADWDTAEEEGTDLLEDEAARRAAEGVDEPVFYKGVVAGVVRKYSDTLLIVLLKARRPDKYRERQETTHKGDPSAPILVRQITAVPPGEADDDRAGPA